jgi:hypothetical protein
MRADVRPATHMHPILEEFDAPDRRLLRRRAIPAFMPLMPASEA